MFGLFKPKCPVCGMHLASGDEFCSDKCKKEFGKKVKSMKGGGSCCGGHG
ncbi:MAG: DUF2116 family Zn-ribbon domain-containing protein [Candidatus Burarchaeum sp.]|nr:DUF2116 family Zn-ribbon domain-containing protein [Candidatus Burarchaeum sp.]MDO8339717.1 DUF2116 family Zn-ribbon domain-containing protein [Candidatus Burarchaeum sp.]